MSKPIERNERLYETDTAIDAVLRGYPHKATQREASVLASVTAWLGTDCGRALLRQAEENAAARHCTIHDAYLVAWSLENARRRRSDGLRMIEHILNEATETASGGAMRHPSLSASDFEVVEHLMLWLGEREGRAFLLAACAEVTRRQRTESAVEEPKPNLRDAAQARVNRWDTPLWKDAPNTTEFITKLRHALKTTPLQVCLSEGEVDGIGALMPGGVDAFLKTWGWRQFARAVEAKHGILPSPGN